MQTAVFKVADAPLTLPLALHMLQQAVEPSTQQKSYPRECWGRLWQWISDNPPEQEHQRIIIIAIEHFMASASRAYDEEKQRAHEILSRLKVQSAFFSSPSSGSMQETASSADERRLRKRTAQKPPEIARDGKRSEILSGSDATPIATDGDSSSLVVPSLASASLSLVCTESLSPAPKPPCITTTAQALVLLLQPKLADSNRTLLQTVADAILQQITIGSFRSGQRLSKKQTHFPFTYRLFHQSEKGRVLLKVILPGRWLGSGACLKAKGSVCIAIPLAGSQQKLTCKDTATLRGSSRALEAHLQQHQAIYAIDSLKGCITKPAKPYQPHQGLRIEKGERLEAEAMWYNATLYTANHYGVPPSLDQTVEEHHLGFSDHFHLLINCAVQLVRFHDEGVIHGDVKPENVLLALVASKPIAAGVPSYRTTSRLNDFDKSLVKEPLHFEANFTRYPAWDFCANYGGLITARCDIVGFATVLSTLLTRRQQETFYKGALDRVRQSSDPKVYAKLCFEEINYLRTHVFAHTPEGVAILIHIEQSGFTGQLQAMILGFLEHRHLTNLNRAILSDLLLQTSIFRGVFNLVQRLFAADAEQKQLSSAIDQSLKRQSPQVPQNYENYTLGELYEALKQLLSESKEGSARTDGPRRTVDKKLIEKAIESRLRHIYDSTCFPTMKEIVDELQQIQIQAYELFKSATQ